MKTSHVTAACRPALLVVAALMCTPGEVSAVELSTYVVKPSQWGTGSGFYHGHTVTAWTPFNVLNAGGAFTVQCNDPKTLLMTGERAFGRTTTGRERNTVTVTIPERQPAVRNVSGWLQVPGDTTLSCNYRWTSFATEGGYSISAGGIGITYGNETKRDGGTIDFEMYRPPREDADGGCIP
jgi:hypothetical protein